MDLFRQLGDSCGGFISAEDGVSISSIWLKVSGGSPIPAELLICHEYEVFPVRIEAEAPSPLSGHGDVSSFPSKWKAKGKSFEVCSAMVGLTIPLEFLSPMAAGVSNSAMGPSELGGLPEEFGRKDSLDTCKNKVVIWCSDLLSPILEAQLSEDVTSEDGAASKVPLVGFISNQIAPLLSQPPEASVPVCLAITLDERIGLSPMPNKNKFEDSSLGPFSHLVEPNSLLLDQHLEIPCPHLTSTGDITYDLEPIPFLSYSLPLPPPDPLPSCSFVPSASEAESQICIEASPLPSNQIPIELQMEENLTEMVREVASVIGLDLNGSTSDGEKAVTKVCKEVLSRKSSKMPTTRTERELKSLGLIGIPNPSASLPPRHKRSITPFDPSHEF
ncbi:hypothetical protein LINPERPRIM_LOCUS17950 [Linum perenne]